MFAILGVIAVVTAVGFAIGGSITGHSIFGGETNSASDYSQTGSGDGGTVTSTYIGDTADILNPANDTNETVFETKKSGGGGGGGSGGGGSSPDPTPEETCNGLDDDLDGLVDEVCGNVSCTIDSECDDNNSLTIDSCRDTIVDFNNETNESVYDKTCVNLIPNVYGTTYDADNGAELEGINVSVYDESVYDVYDDEGNYSALAPKSVPDAVTDENGKFGVFVDPDEIHHLVFQGSDEKAFNIKARENTSEKIVTETEGYIKVYFEKASAGLKSDLFVTSPTTELLTEKSEVGKVSYVNDSFVYPAGTELTFAIQVHGGVWKRLRNHYSSTNGEYNHSSDSKFAQIERLDKDTWRIHFEDLPEWWKPDWDFNDAVVLVDIVGNVTNETATSNDCDEDGIVNWLDDDDSCDVGEENQELDENLGVHNFNAEGHILYYGQYKEDNKYVCGDKLKFMMFGVNNGDFNETITFAVQDHTSIGGPNAPLVYNGSFSNENESLMIPAGEKRHKQFDFEIPCSFSEGKHDIHIVWGNDSKFHKIGNFFVIKDTTAPGMEFWGERADYVGKPIEIGYSAFDYPEPGTIRALNLGVVTGGTNYLNVTVDKDINTDSDNDTIRYNDADQTINAGDNQGIDLIYNKSGNYTARFSVVDGSNNTDYTDLNLQVYITEEEANETAFKLYEAFNLLTLLTYDKDQDIGGVTNWDRYTPEKDIMGDEYYGPEDNILNDSINNLKNNKCGQPYIRVFGPVSTIEAYNQTIYNHLMWVKCYCNETFAGTPDCP